MKDAMTADHRGSWLSFRVWFLSIAVSMAALNLYSSVMLVPGKTILGLAHPGLLPMENTPTEYPICTLDDSDLEDTFIHKHQYGLEGKTCQDTNYLVIEPSHRGFGAAAYGLAGAMSMHMDKTNVVTWKWNNGFMQGIHNASQCPNQAAESAWECYFKPVSKCSLQDALDAANAKTIDDIPQWSDSSKDIQVAKVKGFFNFDKRKLPEKAKVLKPIDVAYKPHDPWMTQAFRFLMQFNKETKELLRPHLQAIRETVKDMDSSRTIALPIRGSDKCGEDASGVKTPHESDCLPFRGYMDSLRHVWELDNRVTDVIVTSEDIRYINAVKKFAKEPPPPGFEDADGNHKFKFHFNEADVHPGGGLMENIMLSHALSSHFDIVKSMWTTIELALQARYYVINCYSNFHMMMVSYRASTCKGKGDGPPIVICLDRAGKQGISGFDITTIKKGGDYDGRWEY